MVTTFPDFFWINQRAYTGDGGKIRMAADRLLVNNNFFILDPEIHFAGQGQRF